MTINHDAVSWEQTAARVAERLRTWPGAQHSIMLEAADEIERLLAALQRIDGINDNPACFNPDIDEVLRHVLRRDQPGVAGEPEPEHQNKKPDLKADR